MGLRTEKFKLQETDRRMSGSHLFSHRIKVYWNDDFLKIRQWCFETFGPACELELFQSNQRLGLGYVWAWRSDYHKREIYLNTEQLSAFILYNT